LSKALGEPIREMRFHRAEALRHVSLGTYQAGFEALEAAQTKVGGDSDDETLVLLAELAWRSGQEDQATAVLKKMARSSSPKTRFVVALVNGDKQAVSALATEQYLPASVQPFVQVEAIGSTPVSAPIR